MLTHRFHWIVVSLIGIECVIGACSSPSNEGGAGGSKSAGTAGSAGTSAPGGMSGGGGAVAGRTGTGGSAGATAGGGSQGVGDHPGGTAGDEGSGGDTGGGAGQGGGAAGSTGLGGRGGEAGGRGGSSSAGESGGGRDGGVGVDAGSGAQSAGCSATSWPTSKSYTISVTYNGVTKSRQYILRIPDNYDTSHPYRLIIAFHWLGGTMDQVANGGGATSKPFYGLWDLANGSTIFVAPQGIDPTNGWADTGGPGDPHDGPTNQSSTGGQDIAFVKALVQQLEQTLCIDTTRVMAEGFSMGGSMSYAVACAMPDVFRAVAVHSGGPMSGCVTHKKPVAYFMTHGEQDGTCTYPSYGVPELKDFSMVDGCMWPNLTTSTGLPAPTGATGTHQCVDLAGCMAGYPVRSCIFVGPHTPSSPDTGPSNWIPGEAWKFLSQF